MTRIAFSRGTGMRDAYPAQRSAESFDAFEATVLRDRSQRKGQSYIAAPFKNNGDGRAHRCEADALPRAWLPFDLDGVRDGASFIDLCMFLQRYRGFGYTTASHQPEAPRARIVLLAARPVDRTEGQRVCLALERDIKRAFGDDIAKFDRSVYRAEQPCFTPLTDAQTFRFDGAPVDVDAILPTAPEFDERRSAGERAKAAASNDPILRHLFDNNMVKRELAAGRYAVDCPCADSHTSESNETSTVYMLPNFGGVRYGKFHCLHDHCAGRDQKAFIEALGLDPSKVWKAQSEPRGDAADAEVGEDHRGAENATAGDSEGAAAQQARATKPDDDTPSDDADPGAASREAAEQLLRHPSEQNVALAFASLHANELRFCAERGVWYRWDGTRWRHESTGLALDFAARLARESNHGGKPAMLKASFARGVETLARVNRTFAVRRDVFDASPFLLATPGGTFDLERDTLRPARQRDYLTRNTNFAPEAGEPRLFLEFLRFAFDGDDEMVAFVQRAFGYSLTGDTRHECLFFGVGSGGNGKGTLFGAFTNILGDYAHQAPLDMFLSSRAEQHPTSLAALDGARFVIASQISRGRAWDDQKVKCVTGGDRITAHFMRQDDFTFAPKFKLWIAANTRPRIRVIDDAWRRRLLLLPFDCKPERPDTTLKARLVPEYGRILAWAAAGCAAWRDAGHDLRPPARVTVASSEYLSSQDVMSDFFAERCEMDPQAWTSRKVLLAAWREFAEALDAFVGTPADLYDRLQREFNVVERIREGNRGFA